MPRFRPDNTGEPTPFSAHVILFLILCAILGGIAYGIYYGVTKSKNEKFLSYKSIEKKEEAMKTHNSYR